MHLLVVPLFLGVLFSCLPGIQGATELLPEDLNNSQINLRSKTQGQPTRRRTQVAGFLCALVPFLCDEEADSDSIQCPEILPLSNQTGSFDFDEYTTQTWFVQKQQVNAFQLEDDMFCVTMSYLDREGEDEFLDYEHYGNVGYVNGPIPVWNTSDSSILDIEDSWDGWCVGQDQYGGGLLRVVPCTLRPFAVRVGIPQWVIAVADDYSWAIVSGGEPDVIRQTDPVLCSTKTDTSSLLDSSGSGLWLMTRERIADEDTIFEMEQVLLDMGVYTDDLLSVEQEGCIYEGATIKGPTFPEAMGLNDTLSNATNETVTLVGAK